MHRLRTRRKTTKEESTQKDASNKLTKRGKSAPAPVKEEIDLSAALPSTDDFRTSLLMPNLANRFSILKDADGNEIVVDANGNRTTLNGVNGNVDGSGESQSQTYHARQSGFGFQKPFASNNLADISETSSLAEPVIPHDSLRDSHSSGGSANNNDSSVMNRGRGYEGNIMFGGRQKIYKINTMAEKEDGEKSGSGGGGGFRGRVFYEDDLPAASFASGPRKISRTDDEYVSPLVTESPTTYDNDRDTTSSFNSMPTTITRSSTAATSVTSGTRPPSSTSPTTSMPPKPAPRRPLYEQALDLQLQEQQNKIDLFQRSRSPIMANYSLNGRSTPQLNDRSGAASPVSPLDRDSFAKFDFGPAVTKVTTPTSPESKPFPATITVQDTSSTAPTEITRTAGGYDDDLYQSRFQNITTTSPSPRQSIIEEPDFDHLDVLSQIKTRNSAQMSVYSQEGIKENGTFLSTADSGSEYDSDQDDYAIDDRSIVDEIPPLNPQSKNNLAPAEYPRKDSTTIGSIGCMANLEVTSQASNSPALRAISPASPVLSDPNADNDSPTLPPGQGLSLLIRQHLRTDSVKSSIYAPSTYTRASRQLYGNDRLSEKDAVRRSDDTKRPSIVSGSSGGDAWEFDEWDRGYKEHEREVMSTDHAEDDIPRRKTPEEEIEQVEKQWMEDRSRALDESPQDEKSPDAEWESELEQRKRMVTENLRSQSSDNLREARGRPQRSDGMNGLPLNESERSGEFRNMELPEGVKNKAVKMLGIQEGGRNSPIPGDRPERGPHPGPGPPHGRMRGPPRDLTLQTGRTLPYPDTRHDGPLMGPYGVPRVGPHGGPRTFPPEGPPHFHQHPAYRNGPPPRGPPGQMGPPNGMHPMNGRPPMRGPPLRTRPSLEQMGAGGRESPAFGHRGAFSPQSARGERRMWEGDMAQNGRPARPPYPSSPPHSGPGTPMSPNRGPRPMNGPPQQQHGRGLDSSPPRPRNRPEFDAELAAKTQSRTSEDMPSPAVMRSRGNSEAATMGRSPNPQNHSFEAPPTINVTTQIQVTSSPRYSPPSSTFNKSSPSPLLLSSSTEPLTPSLTPTSTATSPLPPTTPSTAATPTSIHLAKLTSFQPSNPARKRAINKKDIGAPTLLSSTNTVPTVDLATAGRRAEERRKVRRSVSDGGALREKFSMF